MLFEKLVRNQIVGNNRTIANETSTSINWAKSEGTELIDDFDLGARFGCTIRPNGAKRRPPATNLLLTHLLVAHGAGEMVDAPGLVESLHCIATDHLIADEAQEAKELLEVMFAVRLTLLLEVPRSQERLFTARAHKVVHVPGLAQGVHNPFLDRTPGRKEAIPVIHSHTSITFVCVDVSADICVRDWFFKFSRS